MLPLLNCLIFVKDLKVVVETTLFLYRPAVWFDKKNFYVMGMARIGIKSC